MQAKNRPVNDSIFERTPGSMNRLFSDFFKNFAGVILRVYGTICRVPWLGLGVIFKVFGGHLKGKIEGKLRKKEAHLEFNIALDSLFNE